MMAVNDNVKVVLISQLPLWEKTRANRTLLSVTLEITARCNNDCAHCYINLPADDTEAIAKELSTEEIKALVDESVSMGALWFLLTGGEPLLRDDFIEIYYYIKQKGLLVSLFTNATLVSAEHIKLFKKYPPRSIEVTVYGVTEQTYEKVTGKKYLSAAMNGVDRLVSASLPVTLKSTVLRSNFKELDKIAGYCRSLSTLPFRFDPFLHLRIDGNAAKNKTIISERLTPDEIIELEKSDKARCAAIEKKCGELDSNFSDSEETDRIFHCQVGMNSCCIGYDGTFKLCSALSDARYSYNLKTGSLKDAWVNFTPKVKGIKSNKKSFKEKCGSCKIVDLCMWCPAHACLESGHYDQHIQYFCDVAHKRKMAFLTTV
jgi:radical SAM protein with 4Fe4S-binding SPASM domain